MLKKDEVEIEGIITENLPNTTFRVETAEGKQILCVMSGRMRLHHIRVLPGDRVRVVITPYDQERGRITYKLKN
jgi:translation initiation factor IF-1